MLELESPAKFRPPTWAANFDWSEPPPFDPAEIIRLLPRIISPRTGLISTLTASAEQPGEPRLPIYFATLGDLIHSPDLTAWYGTAIGLTEEEAIGATVGEALERYALFNSGVRSKNLPRATYRQVAEQAIDPLDFVHCSEAEYALAAELNLPLRPPSHETEYTWTWAYSLTRRRPVLVPASQVCQGRRFEAAERFTFPSSSGSALGQSRLQATLQGLYEVIERDAFTISWLHAFPAPQLDLARCAAQSPAIKTILDTTTGCQIELHLNNLTTDLGIPVVFCTAINSGSRPGGLVVGASCHLDPEKAVRKALMEGLHCRVFFSPDFQARLGADGPLSPAQVNTRDQHVFLYTQPHMVSELDFLTKAPVQQSLSDLPDHFQPDSVVANLEWAVERLASRGLEVLVADLTTPEIRELGYYAVKVLVPQAQPLNFGKMRYLSGPRLYEVPARLGYAPGLTNESELNPLPHPFP